MPKLGVEIIVFTDANAFYRSDAVRKLIAHFADRRVGLVCGRLHYVPDRDSFMSDEELNRFVSIFVQGQDVRLLEGLETTVKEGDLITILPLAAGG